MKKIVLILAIVLGTSMVSNAATFTSKTKTAKETTMGKHKKHRKPNGTKKQVTTPVANEKK